jgi:hypothetical protein
LSWTRRRRRQDPSKLLALSPAAAEAFARAADGFDAPELVPATQRGPGPSVQGAVTGPTDPAGTTIVVERVALGRSGHDHTGNVKLAAFTPVQQQIGNVLDRIETLTDDQGNFRIADGCSCRASTASPPCGPATRSPARS